MFLFFFFLAYTVCLFPQSIYKFKGNSDHSSEIASDNKRSKEYLFSNTELLELKFGVVRVAELVGTGQCLEKSDFLQLDYKAGISF